MSWTARIILGLAATAAAGSAMACDRYGPCGHHHGAYEPQDRYVASRAYSDRDDEAYSYRAVPPPCRSGCGEITLPGSFFAGAGGVGPIPSGPIYGGGYVYVRGGGYGGARAFATSSASASARARVSVSVSGGHRSGGCCR